MGTPNSLLVAPQSAGFSAKNFTNSHFVLSTTPKDFGADFHPIARAAIAKIAIAPAKNTFAVMGSETCRRTPTPMTGSEFPRKPATAISYFTAGENVLRKKTMGKV